MELSAGRALRGKTELYKAGFVDRIASVYANRDWVTPLWISPQTCPGLFLGGLVNWRTSQFVDDGPVPVGRTCMPTFL